MKRHKLSHRTSNHMSYPFPFCLEIFRLCQITVVTSRKKYTQYNHDKEKQNSSNQASVVDARS